MVSRRETQIFQDHGGIKRRQHGSRPVNEGRRKTFSETILNSVVGEFSFRADDHGTLYHYMIHIASLATDRGESEIDLRVMALRGIDSL